MFRMWRKHILHGFEILVPPYVLDYDHWTVRQAEEYLQWYVSHIPERAAYVYQLAGGKGQMEEPIDPECLLVVWRWFLKIAEIEPVPKAIVDAQREKFAKLGESFLTKEQFSVRTEYILRAIAMLISAVFTTNYPALYWDVIRKPKRDVNYLQPVLCGFVNTQFGKPFHDTFPPDHMVGVQAAKCLDRTEKRATERDLLIVYRYWEQCVPDTHADGDK